MGPTTTKASPRSSFPEHEVSTLSCNVPTDHFRFLKQSILASLESQGLIHNAKLYVPIRTKEELLDAERGQAKRYRRAVLEAKRERAPLPTRMPEMKTTVADYYWSLGPLPEDIEERRSLPDLDEPLTKEEVDFKAPPAAWAQAERLEEHFHKARLMDEENIAERKRIRKEKYLEERQQRKLQREEDIRLGRDGRLAQERRRMRALQSIEEYAQQTGEDVSDWIEELETAELGDEFPDRLPSFRPVHTPRIDGRVRLTPLPPRKNWKKTAVNRK